MKQQKNHIFYFVLLCIFLFSFPVLFRRVYGGTPWERRQVIENSRQYIAQNYGGMHLVAEDPVYQESFYTIKLSKPNSQDFYFSLCYSKDGTFLYDSYESSILSCGNTVSRLIEDYQSVIKSLEEKIDKSSKLTRGPLYAFFTDDFFNQVSLELDKEYDTYALAKNYGQILLRFSSTMRDPEIIQQYLIDFKNLCDKNNVPFHTLYILIGDRDLHKNWVETFFLYEEVGTKSALKTIEKALADAQMRK